MVVLISKDPHLNNSNSSSSPSPNRLLWEKLKKTETEQKTKLELEQQKNNNQTSKRRVVSKKMLAFLNQSSSSSSSLDVKIDMAKRSTMQEKLFLMECSQSKEKKIVKKPVKQYVTNKKPNVSANKLKELKSSEDEENNQNLPTTSSKSRVLHLQPSMLQDRDVSSYYNNHGRMEFIDWSILEDTNNSNNIISTTSNIQQNNNSKETVNDLKTIAETKPSVTSEFSNFVANTTTPRTLYGVYNNVDQIKSDRSPMFKLQRRILNNKNIDNVSISEEVTSKFSTTSSKCHVINMIDAPITRSNLMQNGMSETIKDIQENHKIINEKEPHNAEPQKYCNAYEFEENLTTIIHNKPSKHNKNIKELDANDDELFNFVSPGSKQNSNSSKLSKIDNFNNSASSKSCSSSISRSNGYFNKLKQCCKEKPTSADSDDTSLIESSEFNELSILRKSTYSKYKVLKKMKDASTQYSPTCNIGIEVIDLKSDTSIVNNTNTIETAKDIIKDSMGEILLKPISTRYFSKSSKDIYKDTVTNDEDEQMMIIKTGIDTKQIKFQIVDLDTQEEKSEKDCAIVENITSISEEDILDKNSVLSNNEDLKDKSVIDEENTISDVHENLKGTSVLIEEISSKSIVKDSNSNIISNTENMLEDKVMSSNLVTLNNETNDEYVNSEEEYDIVNIEQFNPFKKLINALQTVQKEFDPRKYEKNSESTTIEEIDKPEQAKQPIDESSIDESDNNYLSVSASLSSNADTDTDISNNIFKNVKINSKELFKKRLDYYDKRWKSNNETTSFKSKAETSRRLKKMTKALKDYETNHQTNDTGERN